MDHALTRWSKGSVRDRLCLPDCLRASGPGSYIVPLRWRGGRQRRHFNAAKGGIYAHRSEGAIPQPSAPEALSNLRTLRPPGRSNLGTFYTTLLHNPPPIGGHNLRRSRAPSLICGAAATTTLSRQRRLSNLRTFRPIGRSILRTLFIYPSFFSQGNEEKKDHFITYFFLEGEKKKDDSLRNDGGPGPSGQ